MNRILLVTILTVATSALAVSQTDDRQAGRNKSERELLLLSRAFVKTSFGAFAVEMGGMKMTPHGPVRTAEIKARREAVGIKDTELDIKGNSAVVTGRVALAGHSSQDKTADIADRVTIRFLRQQGQWKLVRGCFGECGDR